MQLLLPTKRIILVSLISWHSIELFIFYLFIFWFQTNGCNFKHSSLHSILFTFKWKKKPNPRPTARKAVTRWCSIETPGLSKLYFKNGFKFHIFLLLIRLLLVILHFVSSPFGFGFWKFIPHYYVICNSSVYAWVIQYQWQVNRWESYNRIANIVRKSDQLRGIRELQIKIFFCKLFTDWELKKETKKEEKHLGPTNLAQGKTVWWKPKGAKKKHRKCIFHKAKMKNRQ